MPEDTLPLSDPHHETWTTRNTSSNGKGVGYVARNMPGYLGSRMTVLCWWFYFQKNWKLL